MRVIFRTSLRIPSYLPSVRLDLFDVRQALLLRRFLRDDGQCQRAVEMVADDLNEKLR
jgi:hypothetical protein